MASGQRRLVCPSIINKTSVLRKGVRRAVDTGAGRIRQLRGEGQPSIRDQFRFEATVRKAYFLVSDIHNKLDPSFPESHIMDPKPLPGVEDVLSVRRMEERYGEMPELND